MHVQDVACLRLLEASNSSRQLLKRLRADLQHSELQVATFQGISSSNAGRVLQDSAALEALQNQAASLMEALEAMRSEDLDAMTLALALSCTTKTFVLIII